MKVHVLLNIYNDCMFLSPMLNSIKDDADSIIVADGAYELYYKNYLEFDESAKPWSTDGSLEIVKAIKGLPETHILRCPDGKPWKNQCDKRNALVKAVPNDDWLIVMDADTMLYGDIATGLQNIFDSGCAVGNAPVYNVGLDESRIQPFWHPQMFLKMPGMHYSGTHWLLRDAFDRIIEAVYPIKSVDDFVMVHFKWLRSWARLTPHQKYMEQMSKQGWVEPRQIEVKA